MKSLYISATSQDCGKTSIICGLFQALRKRGYDLGYIKPVGQRYVEYDGVRIDKDAALMRDAFGLEDPPQVMSPIVVTRGFTTRWINDPDTESLEAKLADSVKLLNQAHADLLVEGTGHAGVGSCFGLSNARVASLLGTRVIIVTAGGIGRPIDDVALSLSLFRECGLTVMGVILNKVYREKLDKVKATVARGLKHFGTQLLGAVPHEPMLGWYTVDDIAREFDYDVLCGSDRLGNRIEHTVVAAMEPQNVLPEIRPGTLIVTPGDRVDNILISLILSRKRHGSEGAVGGLVLTGGFVPGPEVLELMSGGTVPVLACKDNTFEVAGKLNDMICKIQARDTAKIAAIHELVEEHVEIDRILAGLSDQPGDTGEETDAVS